MAEINTGGPAFPRPFSQDDIDADLSYPAHSGMTLRDYFAAKAMFQAGDGVAGTDVKTLEQAMAEIARVSYLLADAMLAAREQQ